MKTNTFKTLVISGILLFASSCEILQQAANELPDEIKTNIPLSEQEVVSGLKEALRVSTDTSVKIVSKTNGFFKDKAIKILLPPEAKVITDNKDNAALKAIGVSKLIDDVILRINRSAENASSKARPIFIDAIKKMTITDAFKILNGADNAATEYFRKTTYNKLYQAFSPIMKKALDKPLVANISTTKSWNTLVSSYNKVANYTSWKKVNTDLNDYATKKTIDGLFKKLAEEEKAIRHDPKARVTDILKRVFN